MEFSDIVSFEAALESCMTNAEIGDALENAIAAYGFSASACGAFLPSREGARPIFYFQNWPSAWLERYSDDNSVNHDFGVAEARRRFAPFDWLEVKSQRQLSVSERKLWGAFLEFGWRNGLSFPFHGPGGYFGLVTMAGREERFTAMTRIVMSNVAMLAHQRCRRIHGDPDLLETAARLSSRELECIRWVAAGRSDVEIAATLQIGGATVKDYIDTLRKKIGARSRAQAVAIVMGAGLI